LEILNLLVIFILILLNALFVAVEFALVAVRRTRIEEMIKQGIGGATSVENAQKNMDRSIAAAQLGITVASILLGAVAESSLAHLLEPVFSFLPPNAQGITRHGLAVALALVLITFLHVILGEQIPKMIAIQSPDDTALWLSGPLNFFARISSPLLRCMNGSGHWLMRRMGFKPVSEEESVHSVEELRMIIEDSQEAGLLDHDQAIFLQNVFQLTDKTVRECMVRKEKMDAIEIHMPQDKLLQIVRDSGHTRLPVYDGELNNIVGILNTKNLFYFFSIANVVVLEDALYPATYLDPDEVIANALRLFRKSRKPMAMVRDKDGNILGMITLEDVLEEIVGDLEDEHDQPLQKVSRNDIVRRRGLYYQKKKARSSSHQPPNQS
jgi:putative hemolysin